MLWYRHFIFLLFLRDHKQVLEIQLLLDLLNLKL